MQERRDTVLRLLIQTYLETGAPVSSRTMCSQFPLGLCSASIRNVMADLEELGYITHLHTSAGRVPTDKGYRFYVDRLVPRTVLTPDEQQKINRELMEKQVVLEDVIRNTSRILSDFTHYAAVVAFPDLQQSGFKSIQLAWLEERKICLTFVSTSGFTKSQVISLETPIDREWMLRIENFLNEQLENVPLTQARSKLRRLMIEERNSFFYVMKQAVELLELSALNEQDVNIYLEGIGNIIKYSEFENAEMLRSLLRVVEEKKKLADFMQGVIAQPAEHSIRVFIGEENPYEDLSNYSLIVGTYRIDDQSSGVLGIIGPKRLEYGRAIATVEYVTQILGQTISRFNLT
ncbi:MAG: heat-inducible transcriptional repressor HrcA [Candidatus Omnitrophica bacterium]|nr:heat-inducible transcriptional repressor HrcA [Candidatus Omnitrophota bacterium]